MARRASPPTGNRPGAEFRLPSRDLPRTRVRTPYPRSRISSVSRQNPWSLLEKRIPPTRSAEPARLGILAMAVVAPIGCTREFYREWANQDVTEAVFEKTRDPRWRLDTFSVEPPALSRFADPYDQDFPPAPPDDPAAEALSPVPQWPDHRLIVPAEGTGYLDLLERWKDEQDAAAGTTSNVGSTRPPGQSGRIDMARAQPLGRPPGPPQNGSPLRRRAAPAAARSRRRSRRRAHRSPRRSAPSAEPRRRARGPEQQGPGPGTLGRPVAVIPPGGLSGRRTGGNSGPESEHSTPILLADARPGKSSSTIPPPRPASSFTANPTGRAEGLKDGEVRRTARQDGRSPASTSGAQLPQEPAVPDARRPRRPPAPHGGPARSESKHPRHERCQLQTPGAVETGRSGRDVQ